MNADQLQRIKDFGAAMAQEGLDRNGLGDDIEQAADFLVAAFDALPGNARERITPKEFATYLSTGYLVIDLNL